MSKPPRKFGFLIVGTIAGAILGLPVAGLVGSVYTEWVSIDPGIRMVRHDGTVEMLMICVAMGCAYLGAMIGVVVEARATKQGRLTTFPQISRRRLLVAVAVLAFLFWGAFDLMPRIQKTLARRSVEFEKRSLQYVGDRYTVDLLNELVALNDSGDPASQAKYIQAFSDYRRNMFLKYQKASERPWLPVWPDQPEPKQEDFGLSPNNAAETTSEVSQ